jgi:AbrB family looped-hinge helix DNA binding protein
MGVSMGEAVIDERGRIVIPNEIRAELNLRPEQKLKVMPRGRELVLSPAVGTEEFISQLKGCIHGSKVKPEELKTIWGESHPHH